MEAKKNSKLFKRIKNDKRKRKNEDEKIKKSDYEEYDEDSISKGDQFTKTKKLKTKP